MQGPPVSPMRCSPGEELHTLKWRRGLSLPGKPHTTPRALTGRCCTPFFAQCTEGGHESNGLPQALTVVANMPAGGGPEGGTGEAGLNALAMCAGVPSRAVSTDVLCGWRQPHRSCQIVSDRS